MQHLTQLIAIMISGEWKIITLNMNWWTGAYILTIKDSLITNIFLVAILYC